MATRWMKWNEGTHIFEYSTDGVTFNPLPLDASILTQGTIDPARLPASVPGGGSDNIWTGTNVFSGVEPKLRFNETDQAVGSKNWEVGAVDGTFKVRALDDAFATPVELLSLTRGGILSINASGSTVHKLAANFNGANLLDFANPNAGSGAYSGLSFQNNLGIQRTLIVQTSSTFVAAGWVADAINIMANGVGGVNIAGNELRFKIGVTDRLVINTAGDAKFSGNITTRGRATADGVWTTLAYAGANFAAQGTTWTVEAADHIHYRYTYLSANTMMISFDIRASSVAAATPYLHIKVPDGRTISNNTCGSGIASNNGATAPLGAFALAAQTVVWLTPSFISGTQWAASVNNTAVAGCVILDLQ